MERRKDDSLTFRIVLHYETTAGQFDSLLLHFDGRRSTAAVVGLGMVIDHRDKNFTTERITAVVIKPIRVTTMPDDKAYGTAWPYVTSFTWTHDAQETLDACYASMVDEERRAIGPARPRADIAG